MSMDVLNDQAWVDAVRRALIDWYEREGRQLPWRGDHDPYRVLVSEMMLVQTTVTAVIPYFRAFLDRFPTIASLAAASEEDVLQSWEGLGYYRRARQLHATAHAVMQRHGGVLPSSVEDLMELPGVGRYVAGAVASLAFDEPAPIVEANSRRVLARLLAWDEDLGTAASQKRLWQAAARLVPSPGARAFNQAMMDLGAMICTPTAPRCLICPVRDLCQAYRSGLQGAIPVLARRKPPEVFEEECAVVQSGGRFLLVRRERGGLWGGFWEFPTRPVSGADPARRREGLDGAERLEDAVLALTGVQVRVGAELGRVPYSVTKHRGMLVARAAVPLDGGNEPTPGPGYSDAAWVDAAALGKYPAGSAQRRVRATALHRLETIEGPPDLAWARIVL